MITNKDYINDELDFMIKNPEGKKILTIENFSTEYIYNYIPEKEKFSYEDCNDKYYLTKENIIKVLLSAKSFIFIDYEKIRRQQQKLAEFL